MKYITNTLFPKHKTTINQLVGGINLANWDTPPYNRWAFNNINSILPTKPVAHNPQNISKINQSPQDITPMGFTTSRGRKTTIGQFIHSQYIDNLLVWHRGSLLFEGYYGYSSQQTPHLCQSVSKSVLGAVCQYLKGEGVISGQEKICDILPKLSHTAYRGATIQHALDMRSGVDFKETYGTIPLSGDCLLLDIANGWKPASAVANPPANNMQLAMQFKNTIFDHGYDMLYRCLDTDVVGHCIEAICQKDLNIIISEILWQKLGCEQAGFYTIDPSGFPIASGGFCAIARDLLRFGLMMLQGGAYNNQQIISEKMVADCYDPAPLPFNPGHPELAPCGGYKNYFWILKPNEVIICVGVYGQMIYINRPRQCVVVKMASYPYSVQKNLWYNEVQLGEQIANQLG